MTSSLVVAVAVDAPQPAVWAAVTDWARQGDWMPGTTVVGIGPTAGRAVGEQLRAFTGLGAVGFLDTMEITRWDPPDVCEVRHTGRLVRGTGVFRVQPLAGDRSRFVWAEHLDLPLGPLGRLGWPLLRPGFAAGLRHGLRALAREVAAEYRSAAADGS